MARLIARVSLDTGLGPADLLAAPPSVLQAIIEYADERARKRKHEERLQRLKGGR